MDKTNFLEIARSAIDRFEDADFDRPIGETSLDSLDLMVLRSALETHSGKAIADDDWFASRSLAELCGRLA